MYNIFCLSYTKIIHQIELLLLTRIITQLYNYIINWSKSWVTDKAWVGIIEIGIDEKIILYYPKAITLNI